MYWLPGLCTSSPIQFQIGVEMEVCIDVAVYVVVGLVAEEVVVW